MIETSLEESSSSRRVERSSCVLLAQNERQNKSAGSREVTK